jgi:hypothetical protein
MPRSRRVPPLAFLFAALALALPALQPHPVHADATVGNGDPTTCTASAFSTALNAGGKIIFNCGPAPKIIFVPENIPAAGDTVIDGGGKITLSGSNNNRIFRVNAGSALTLTNITLAAGYSNLDNPNAPGYGGAIWNNAGRIALVNSSVEQSRADTAGGAIHNSFGSLYLTDSRILTNTGPYGGGVSGDGGFEITRSTIRGNMGSNTGNGLYLQGNAIVVDSVVMSNTGALEGGGIDIRENATVSLVNTDVIGNKAQSEAGGIDVRMPSNVEITNSRILSNRLTSDPATGAGIANRGSLTVTGSLISGNIIGTQSVAPTNYGGGIYHRAGSLTVVSSTIRSNVADYGGGISSTPNGALTSVTIRATSIVTNLGRYNGGGLWLGSGSGGALIANSTVGDNRSFGVGGIALNNMSLSLINDTFSNNVTILGAVSTLTSTTSTAGSYKDTIFSGPSGKAVCSITDDIFSTSGFNIASDNTCFLGSPGDQPSKDPKLGPLADNGGPTQTYYPAADSLARNGGSGCPATDQRGAPRPLETACDIGAVEVAFAPTLSALSPNTTTAGAAAFNLTLTGSNFLPGATALWNGAARTTTYVGPTQLTASILVSDVAAAGTAQVSVRNAANALETSGALPFAITASSGPGPEPSPSPNPNPNPSGLFQFLPVVSVNRTPPG